MSVSVSLTVWCIWLCIIHSAASKEKVINAEFGKNTTLPCRDPNNNVIVVEWSRAGLGTDYVLLYRDERLDTAHQHPSFKNRVDLQDRRMKDGDVSLILKNVTINDTGTYECRVFHIGRKRKRDVLDTDPISTITLSVAPPPPPGHPRVSAGLIVGQSVPAVLLAAAAAVVL